MTKKKFVETLLTNLLIVLTLIPIAMMFNALYIFYPDPYIWLVIGIVCLLLFSYITYKFGEENDRK